MRLAKKLQFLAIAVVFVLVLAGGWYQLRSAQIAAAQSTIFTAEELAKYDGRDGRPSYFAYKGKVYDVTASPLWKLGEHYGLQAGQDLSGKLENAPHGEEVFVAFKIVGVYPESAPTTTALPSSPAPEVSQSAPVNTATEKPWYEGRIRLFGISILGWTGIAMGVFFFLTFATCFAMPWAKLPLPWKGAKPGKDALDSAPRHLTWSSIHKYFVWITVALGIVHGVLGYMQMLWNLYL